MSLLRRFNREQKFRISATVFYQHMSLKEARLCFSYLARFYLEKAIYFTQKEFDTQTKTKI